MILSFHRASRGLTKTKEYWQKDSFRDRERQINELCKAVNGGHAPSKNMWTIRELTLNITPKVTVDRIVKVTEKIRSIFIIDCFQVSIDRKMQQAHLLFDFLNRETGSSVEIHQSNLFVLGAFFIKHLDLPVRDDEMVNWSHFSIRCDLLENPDILDVFLDECKRSGMSRFFYRFARDLVDFVGHRMSNSTKNLKKIR